MIVLKLTFGRYKYKKKRAKLFPSTILQNLQSRRETINFMKLQAPSILWPCSCCQKTKPNFQCSLPLPMIILD
jgi:hypothetical protein